MGEENIVKLDDTNFAEEVLNSETPVLVDFWAPWCGACQMAAPVLDKIAQEYKGRLKVCKLNVDEGRETAISKGIQSIPTLQIYKDGELVDQIIGVVPGFEAELKKRIDALL